MTAEQYAQLAADAQAKIGQIIAATAPKAKVLLHDPVDTNNDLWIGGLLSADDLDPQGKKRAHTWLVTFAGILDPETAQNRSIAPTLPFRVQLFHAHWYVPAAGEGEAATPEQTSEAAVRAEVLKVQLAFAEKPKLDLAGVSRHAQLRMRVALGRMRGKSGDVILHRGDGELSVELMPFNVY